MKSLIDPNPYGHAAPVLLEAWRDLSNLVQAQLLAQTQLKPKLRESESSKPETKAKICRIAAVRKLDRTVFMRLAGRSRTGGRWTVGVFQ